MTRPFFSRDRISHFNLFERHADELIGLMVQRFRDGHAIDVQDAFSRFTLDSATEFLFGTCVHSLKSGLPHSANANVSSGPASGALSTAEEFAKAFSHVQDVIAERTRLGPYWPLWEIFGNKTAASMKIVIAFLDPILASALEKRSVPSDVTDAEKSDEIDDDETLLDHLAKFTDGNSISSPHICLPGQLIYYWISDKIILKDEILNIMIAGRDTVSGFAPPNANMFILLLFFLP